MSQHLKRFHDIEDNIPLGSRQTGIKYNHVQRKIPLYSILLPELIFLARRCVVRDNATRITTTKYTNVDDYLTMKGKGQ